MQDSQQLEIRDTTADDIVALRTMHARSWMDTYESSEHGVSREWLEERTSKWTSPEGIARSHEHFKDIFGNPDQLHQIAIDANGSIVGFVHVGRNEEGHQHFHALYVDKSYHGTGLAQRLMDRAIAWSDPDKPLDLQVATYNERAKAFYRKYNFVEVPGTEEYFGEVIPVIRMERKGETV